MIQHTGGSGINLDRSPLRPPHDIDLNVDSSPTITAPVLLRDEGASDDQADRMRWTAARAGARMPTGPRRAADNRAAGAPRLEARPVTPALSVCPTRFAAWSVMGLTRPTIDAPTAGRRSSLSPGTCA